MRGHDPMIHLNLFLATPLLLEVIRHKKSNVYEIGKSITVYKTNVSHKKEGGNGLTEALLKVQPRIAERLQSDNHISLINGSVRKTISLQT